MLRKKKQSEESLASEVNEEQEEQEEKKHSPFYLLWGFLRGLLFGATIISVFLIIITIVIPRLLGWVPLTVLTGSMVPKFNPGDLIITMPIDGEDVQRGDIIVFQPESNNPMLITHRVVSTGYSVGGDFIIITKGDANVSQDDPIIADQVMGKYLYHIPYLGWVVTAIPSNDKPTAMLWLGVAFFVYAGFLIVQAFVGKLFRKRRKALDAPPQDSSEASETSKETQPSSESPSKD